MTLKLIGQVYLNKGRIDFSRKENPWAFSRIDAGLKETQRDRIHVDPKQAPIELVSATANEGETPAWLSSMQDILRSSDSIYLQFKSDVLRFRRATHLAGTDKEYVTLGNQDEFDLYAKEHWQRIRYLYAVRRANAYCFDVNTMISHRANFAEQTRRVEIQARLDLRGPGDYPQITFDSSGHHASTEIVEWRGTVKEGEVGRYAPENAHIELAVANVNQPFTFLHENRREFNNQSYTFSGGNFRDQFARLVKKRLAMLEQ